MVLTTNKQHNFEELKAEIFIQISNAKNDKELISKVEDILKFYKQSDLT